MRLAFINESLLAAEADITDVGKLQKSLGVDLSNMQEVGHGTMATVYKVGDKALKITRDNKDVIHTVKAQRIKSNNVVKIHRLSKDGLSSGTAMLLDFVDGPLVPFSTGEWHALIQGSGMDELSDAIKLILTDNKGIRNKILTDHGLNDSKSRSKISEMFKTLRALQSMNINIDDLGDNIIDAGDRYVLIDLGN
jgi:hypothetical protein